MANGMDKGLMALMGIEDDIPADDGLATQPLHQSQSQDASDFFEPMSDSDDDLPINSTPAPPKTTYLQGRQAQATTEGRSSPPSSPPLAPRASTSSLFASSRLPPSPPPPKAKASSSSSSLLFSPGLSPSKVRIAKSPKKNRGSGNGASGFSMFSPTLSPRKPKKTTSSVSSTPALTSTSTPTPVAARFPITSTQHKDVRTTSLSPDLPPSRGHRRGPASPLSTYELQNQTLALSDNDSDVSSLEDNYGTTGSFSKSQKISLRASFTLDANMGMDLDNFSDGELPTVAAATKEIPVMSKAPSQDNDRVSNLDHDADVDNEMEEIMSANRGVEKVTKKSKAAIAKEQLQLQMEREQLMRSTTFKVDQRFKKQTLSSLVASAQSKIKSQPVAQSILPGPEARSSPVKKPVPRTIALDDSSEDETEQDAERRHEEAQWKRSATKALLLSSIPKRERGIISQELKVSAGPLSIDRRLELERALQMSPLSNKIQNMSLSKTPEAPSPATSTQKLMMVSPPPKPDFTRASNLLLKSPQKGQKPGTVANIREFNLQMERQLAKTNMMRRKKLEDEAKRSGIWKSPEEHAAEQLRIEEKRRQGLDPDEEADDEEDGDYNPQEKAIDGDDSDQGGGSADESGSGESDNEDGQEETAEGSELPGQDSGEEAAVEDENEGAEDDEDDEDDAEDDEDSDADEDDEDDEEKVAPVKRVQRKKTVIGDDEDIKVVIVDRSQAFVESESDDQDEEIGADEINSGSEVGDDDDVSDIEQDMEGIDGTQGFGAFFESSYDANKSKKNKGSLDALGRVPSSAPESSLSPILSSDPSQAQGSYDNTQGSIAGALDFLSGKFPTQTRRDRSESVVPSSLKSQVPPTMESQGLVEFPSMDAQYYDDDYLGQATSGIVLPRARNAFEVMSKAMTQESGLRRLHKREAKPKRGPISKGDKSAFIEYEAEEEEDEHMGMGGIDYESDEDQDDYDLGDGMVDTNIVLDTQDVENVKKLHMKQEQDQHDKDISDLVHGIAAGNLWKRRNGQIDDLDLFDEDDLDGRFRRKKKLKVSEKFEKLADNPNTAAFARAFKKNLDDEQLIFLSDPDESADEDGSSKKADKDKRSGKKKATDDSDDNGEEMVASDGDDDMGQNRPLQKSIGVELDDEDEDDDEEESLNTDKRQERLRMARLVRDESNRSFNGSMDPDAIAAMTKGQVLPFDVSSEENWLFEDPKPAHEPSASTRTPAKAKGTSCRVSSSQADTVDEYKDVMRRTKVIRDILDGVDDGPEDDAMSSPSRTRTSSMFGLVNRIVDRTTLSDTSAARSSAGMSGLDSSSHNEVDVTAIVRPRMLARQNSSFLSEDRRNQFLSTVGEDSRGGNASTRVVKEVNRRKMAFATSKKSTTTTSTGSSSAGAATITSTTTTTTSTTTSSTARMAKNAALKNAGVQSASGSSGSSRLLQILSFEGEE
ncbi:hypothetical protein BGX23_004601 [Mortierella sp. AD031]|nr:hypothetical protein BGX23_004601 [Mortierella sp. AD031]